MKHIKAGLLGKKLGHSYSKIIHAFLAPYSYTLFEREENEVENFIKNGPFDAINVTVPYKKTVIPYLDELSDTARRLGAVNTVVRRKDGTLYGDNTDFYGFSYMLDSAKIDVSGKKVLVLGAGGASATVCAVLSERDAAEINVFSSRDNTPENIKRCSDAEIIVNATPVGMYPNNEETPIDLADFERCEGVLDLIYNPARTTLICDAQERGIKCAGGLSMLVAQAVLACEIFTSTKIDDAKIPEIIDKIEKMQENIVLIGMPGCGKSTLGKLLSKRLEREFVDTDIEIVKLAGKDIPEIFAEEGEDAFRDLETRVTKDVSKRSGAVIATGGGVVKRRENYLPLHRNSKIVFLDRDINSLDTIGRPLSQKEGVEKLYRERIGLYRSFADTTVAVSDDAEETYSRLIEALGIKGE